MMVHIKVNKALREYLLGINGGSDIIRPDYQSELWVVVKTRLRTVPSDYKPFPPAPMPDYIRIALPSGNHLDPLYVMQVGAVIESNTLFRNYLDEEGQKQVEAFLMKGFKKTFRDYMTGAVSCNTELAIKEAIYRFCEVHCLEMEAITYEMLRKDWYRYRNRTARGEPSTDVKEQF